MTRSRQKFIGTSKSENYAPSTVCAYLWADGHERGGGKSRALPGGCRFVAGDGTPTRAGSNAGRWAPPTLKIAGVSSVSVGDETCPATEIGNCPRFPVSPLGMGESASAPTPV